MPISKENRRISALRKGIVCLAADKMPMNDRDNSESCGNLSRHTLTGTKDKVRSLSVNNPRKITCVETRSIIDHRRFSYSDAFVKHQFNFQVRNRGLILKNNNDVKKHMRLSKLNCKSASSKSANDFNWVPIPYDEKNVGKLIEVYGKTNVGRKSFLHLLQSSEDLTGKGRKNYSNFLFFFCNFLFLQEFIFSHVQNLHFRSAVRHHHVHKIWFVEVFQLWEKRCPLRNGKWSLDCLLQLR